MPPANYPLNEVLAAIQWIYSMEFKKERGLRAECCENATTALANCVYFQGENIPQLAQVVEQGLLAKLPLTTDTEEAPVTHAQFLSQIIANNSHLMKPEHISGIKGAVERINQVSTDKPELEILSDEGKQLLAQAVQVLSAM